MRLIVDTNRIMAALIKDGLARAVLSSENIEFYALDYILEEVKKYMDYIIKKSKMKGEEIELLLTLLLENVTTLFDEEVKTKMGEAMEIMEDVDPKDAPILACALAISNDGVWTTDKHFDKQDKVKIWKTFDLKIYNLSW